MDGMFITGEMINTENILCCGTAMGYKCFNTNDCVFFGVL